MALGYPGTFPNGTVGYLTIGAVQKGTSALGYPGLFPNGTVGYLTIGGVQEVGASGFTVNVADDLNAWSDASSLRSYCYLSQSDSFTLSDNVSTSLTATILLVNVSDSLNNWSDLALLNSFNYLNVSDSLNNWNDVSSKAVGLNLDIRDNLNNWLDRVVGSGSIAIGFGDTFTLSDSLNPNFPLGLPVNDSLNNWLDGININLGIQVTTALAGINAYDSMMYSWADSLLVGFPKIEWFIGDTLSLSDSQNLNGSIFVSIADGLTLTDFSTNNRSQEVERTFSNNLNNWNDVVYIAFGDSIRVSVEDAFVLPTKDVNSWTDGVDLYGSTNFTNYIRRYLNDKVMA